MLDVYLAGPYQWKDQIRLRAQDLEANGITCTSTWISESHKSSTQLHEMPEDLHEFYAQRDLVDVLTSDVLVLFAVPPDQPPIPRAGRHVEFGVALGNNIPIIVVGQKENIFHYLSEMVTHVETWEDALALLINQDKEILGL